METEPSLLARLYDYGWALLVYWWILAPGSIFALEPMMESFLHETHKERLALRWPKPARQKTFRVLSILAVFLAGFLAFDDVNLKNKASQRTVSALTKDLDDAKAKNSELERKPATSLLPAIKDRSKFVGPLQGFYAEGAGIQRALLARNASDITIINSEAQTNLWINKVANWLQANMTLAGASRFVNNTDKGSYSFELSGDHAAEMKSKRDSVLNSLAGCLTNLEALMRSDQWDPQ